jgi:hypothetical protein
MLDPETRADLVAYLSNLAVPPYALVMPNRADPWQRDTLTIRRAVFPVPHTGPGKRWTLAYVATRHGITVAIGAGYEDKTEPVGAPVTSLGEMHPRHRDRGA